MSDFSTARRTMVEGQIRTFDVSDANVLAAMLEVPRERFLPPERASLAYLDTDIAVDAGGPRAARRLLKPMVFARMLQAAEIAATDKVLDVGCATGYSAAVLARLAGSVVALEQDADLAAAAERNLAAAGAASVSVVRGPLPRGWSPQAPYDRIFLEGAVEIVPPELTAQLAEGGRLVAIVSNGPVAKAMIYLSIHGEWSGRPVFDAAAAPLPGFAKPPAFVF